MVSLRLSDFGRVWLVACCFGLLIWLAITSTNAQTINRSTEVVSLDNEVSSSFYSGSYALIIGVSKYQNSAWRELPGVKEDVSAVEKALLKQKFEVVKVIDPTSAQFGNGFKDFINKYGQNPNNRLLIYFAGHGETKTLSYGAEMGYLVPADAPASSSPDFISTAIPMGQIEVYAKQISAKHVLFVLDACFAGSIFDNGINRASVSLDWKIASKPVRYFLTSGGAGESVPDKSKFREEFIKAIEGLGDLNNDGYVTGREIGTYLTQTFSSSKSLTTPQNGYISDKFLKDGEFVFFNPSPQRTSRGNNSAAENSYQTPQQLQRAIDLFTGLNGKTDWITANQLLLELNSRGDAMAAMWIARSYFLGQYGFNKNEEAGRSLAKTVIAQVRDLANKGNSEAMFLLGDAYLSGMGIEKDYSQSTAWLRKAAGKDNVLAMNTLGFMFSLGLGVPKDPAQSFSYTKLAADRGLPSAISNLGIAFRDGEGTERDYAKALSLFIKAAEKGNRRGMYNLAGMYQDGLGVTKDLAKSIEWYTKAAELGDADAMLELARIFRKALLSDSTKIVANDNNPEKQDSYDFSKAISWYERSADAGSDVALDELGELYRTGDKNFQKNEANAYLFFKKHADKGRTQAIAQLAWAFENGKGVPVDMLKAFKFYETAAQRGNSFSMSKVAVFSVQGKFVPQDYGRAEVLFRQSAEDLSWDGRWASQIGLGELYEKGWGVPQNFQLAISWYYKAAVPFGTDLLPHQYVQTGLAEAQLALGRIYELGPSDVKNTVEAIKWYSRAAHQGSKAAMERLSAIYDKGDGVMKNPIASEVWLRNSRSSVKRFEVPGTLANGSKSRFYVFILDSYLPEEDDPLKFESERLLIDHGVTINREVIESFSKLLKIARENKVSFPDLCVYALEAAKKPNP